MGDVAVVVFELQTCFESRARFEERKSEGIEIESETGGVARRWNSDDPQGMTYG